MEPLDGGHWRTSDTLPVREVVGELSLSYQRRIAYNSYSTAYNEMIFHEIIFHKMQEKHDEYKASKPRLLIVFVVRIGRK